MLHLVEISVPTATVRAATRLVDPLVGVDMGYAVKTWMMASDVDEIRPWALVAEEAACRIIGWARDVPDIRAAAVRYGFREMALRIGEAVRLTGAIVPLRRSSFGGKKPRVERDAAEGLNDAEAAYRAWLVERLVDVEPFATVADATIDAIRHRRVMRKAESRSRGDGRKIVREETIPVVTASITIIPRDAEGVEAWLLRGVGPQKAFGYGGFFPC